MADHFLICPCGEKSKPLTRGPMLDKVTEDTDFHCVGPGRDLGLITTYTWLCQRCYRRATDLATQLFAIAPDPKLSISDLLKDSFIGWTCDVCDKEFTFRKGNWIWPYKNDGLPFFSLDGRKLTGTIALKRCLECTRKLGDPIKIESSCQGDCLKGYFTGTPERVELKGTYPRD